MPPANPALDGRLIQTAFITDDIHAYMHELTRS